ncbi:hypothetical protein J6590_012953 [Homalodisca vitripennis]|nr:hypothetical protein J6590_012953 [Homalodisca vitripennis]
MDLTVTPVVIYSSLAVVDRVAVPVAVTVPVPVPELKYLKDNRRQSPHHMFLCLHMGQSEQHLLISFVFAPKFLS